MEELIDLIVSDSSPSTTSDRIKDLLFSKAAERIEASRPAVAAAMFGENPSIEDQDSEPTGEDE